MSKTRSLKLAQLKLENYIRNLKKLCHESFCNNYESCPKSCCYSKLGLHTSILWALADVLYTLRYNVLDTRGCYPDISYCEGIIESINWISYQHSESFTKTQFKTLRSAVSYSRDLIRYLQKNIKQIEDELYITTYFYIGTLFRK